jgi:hypothetical protein
MTITIGSFSCNTLTAQPYGYEGEARLGLTSRAFRVSGLLTASQWSALRNVYDTWRNTRITDDDSLKTESIGTTVSLSSTSANGISFSNVACWFADAPAGEQLGAYVSASATLVDATQALAVLLRERELAKQRELVDAEQTVDCAKIAADLARRRDETDCELSALAGGLADDFAAQSVTRETLEKTAQLSALGGGASDSLAQLDAQLSVQSKTSELATANAYGETLAGLDAQLSVQSKTSELATANAYGETLAGLDAQLEVAKKTADNAVASAYAGDIAGLDLAREVIDAEARAALYAGAGAGSIQALKTAEVDIEIAESAARVAALGPKLEDLKSSRSLLALYESYLTEDLPDFGSESVGPVQLTLLKPAESRSAGPSVSLTATGNTYISGALGTLVAKDIEGYTTSLSAASLMSWYDSVVSQSPGSGTWFPAAAPSVRAEKVLVNGLVGTRYIVTVTLVQIT